MLDSGFYIHYTLLRKSFIIAAKIFLANFKVYTSKIIFFVAHMHAIILFYQIEQFTAVWHKQFVCKKL